LTEVFIGTGGWAYFHVPAMDSLKAYAQAFNFVEVNASFYSYPSLSQVRSWRNRTSKSFHFAVRCHQDLTHRILLQPVPEAFHAYDRMIKICKTLKADFLHLLTPPSLEVTDETIAGFQEFFKAVDMKSVRVAWEIRSVQGRGLNPQLIKLMRDHGIIHCVDISREDPAYESDVLYTRLLGKGVHNLYQFDDGELEAISRKVDSASRVSYLSFHGIRMYKDAARFKVFREEGKFPQVTGSTGLDSLLEVLREDTRFPCSKSELIEAQGWKVIDLSVDRRVRAEAILKDLPEKVYESLRDVNETLRFKQRFSP